MRIVTFSIQAGPGHGVFNREERTGNIWLVEPEKGTAK
jgi:hypothetical protein